MNEIANRIVRKFRRPPGRPTGGFAGLRDFLQFRATDGTGEWVQDRDSGSRLKLGRVKTPLRIQAAGVLCLSILVFLALAYCGFGQVPGPNPPSSTYPPAAQPPAVPSAPVAVPVQPASQTAPKAPPLPAAPATTPALPTVTSPAQTPPATLPSPAAQKLSNPDAEALRNEAEAGNGAAQFRLGMMLASGKDVPQDLALAATWLRKSAEQGNAAAQFNLAVFYSQGIGAEKNFTEAARWFRKAAQQNDKAAQYNLGVFYATGVGLAQ